MVFEAVVIVGAGDRVEPRDTVTVGRGLVDSRW